jgi:carboxymethylenebutenolidase
MGDSQACIDFLRDQPLSNGKVGVIGMCSGGRHTFMAACLCDGVDAAVDCWGGGVIMSEEELTEARPVSPIEYIDRLECPLLGIFGNDDRHPDQNEVNKLEEELKKRGKNYEFHRYDGAGHGFWYYDKGMYRQEQAMDSFNITLRFFEENLK